MRIRRVSIAVILTLLLAGTGLGLRVRAQMDLPDCTTSHCTYLPMVERQEPPPTPTNTPTSLPTATKTTLPATPTRTQPPATPTRDPAQCAEEYPTVCIPPPPPDLDCPDISYRNFTVLPPDRHNFDSDHDGIGCEQK